MKKTQLLNAEISYLVAGLGHQNLIAIGDSGLPVPQHVKKIDLALTGGVPSFIETLQTVLSELHVEEAVVASEWKEGANEVYQSMLDTMEGVPIRYLAHEQFKQMIHDQVIAVIRTGECTPYANIILKSGVTF